MNQSTKEILKGRTVAYHAILAKAFGSVKLALLWGQISYWSDRTNDPEGWVYKSRTDLFEELGMSRKETETARRDGAKLRVLESKPMGPKNTVHFRIDLDRAAEIIEKYMAENPDKKKGRMTGSVEAKNPMGGEINKIIELFEPVNPSFERLFANTTQRAAVERMVRKYGFEKMAGTVRFLEKISGEKFAPVITTPTELESKLGKLVAFVKTKSRDGRQIISTF